MRWKLKEGGRKISVLRTEITLGIKYGQDCYTNQKWSEKTIEGLEDEDKEKRLARIEEEVKHPAKPEEGYWEYR